MDSTLVDCRTIGGVPLKRNDQCKALLVGNDLVNFTPMEYRLLLLLLDRDMVADKTLTVALFGSDKLDQQLRANLKKHVWNATSKLKPFDLSIRRIHLYGYSLVRRETAN